MKLNTDSWHFKVYKRWLRLKARNYINDSTGVDKMLVLVKGTKIHSLCLYMRVVLFWGPVKIYFFSPKALLCTLNAFLFSYIYVLLASDPSALYLRISTMIILLTVSLVVGMLVVVGIVAGTEYIKELVNNRPKTEKGPNIFWEYLKAKKQKICPTLTFNDKALEMDKKEVKGGDS